MFSRTYTVRVSEPYSKKNSLQEETKSSSKPVQTIENKVRHSSIICQRDLTYHKKPTISMNQRYTKSVTAQKRRGSFSDSHLQSIKIAKITPETKMSPAKIELLAKSFGDTFWNSLTIKQFLVYQELFDMILAPEAFPEDRKSISIKLTYAKKIYEEKNEKDAEKIFRDLSDNLEAQHKHYDINVIRQCLEAQYWLAVCLQKIGDTRKNEEAEGILRNLRRLENGRKNKANTSTFSGNAQIEFRLARCLQCSTDEKKKQEADDIFSALRKQNHYIYDPAIAKAFELRKSGTEKLIEARNIVYHATIDDMNLMPSDNAYYEMIIESNVASEEMAKTNERSQAMARSSFEHLYSQVNQRYSGEECVSSRLQMMFSLKLHTYLKTIGTEMLNEAEHRLRNLRHQKTGCEIFCNDISIEIELAHCLRESGNNQNLDEAIQIYLNLYYSHDKNITLYAHQQIVIGLVYCYSAQKKFSQCEYFLDYITRLSDNHYIRTYNGCYYFDRAVDAILNEEPYDSLLASAERHAKIARKISRVPRSLRLSAHIARIQGNSYDANRYWKEAKKQTVKTSDFAEWRRREKMALEKLRTKKPTFKAL